jgi:ubiquinone biosynthesis protein COQ9
MQDSQDQTLDELRATLAPLLPGETAFDGWTEAALAAAAARLDVPADRARLAFPGGPVDMIDAWFAAVDLAMATALPPEALAAMRVRERVTALVAARIRLLAPDREALRRALSVLANPVHAAAGARLAWRAADGMWHLAGDTAVGTAHYSKRASLAAVYGATLLALLNDDSEDQADTLAFLDRRIEGVMRFERLKAQLRPRTERRFGLTRFLGRLRYPAR